MNYVLINSEVANEICTINFNREEGYNVLTEQVRAELFDALQVANRDPQVRGVILTGGKKIFCGGAVIKFMARATAADMYCQPENTRRIVEYMESMVKPVIAVLSGYTLGGGCELSLGCDIRIASETVQIGLPEIRLGIIPGGGGVQRLVRLVGVSRARDLIYSGRILKASEALDIGLVDEVVPVDQLLEAAVKRMKSYTRHGAVAVAAAKTAINTGIALSPRDADVLEKMCFAMLFSTEDQKEGMQAFIDKRKPAFKGK